MDWIKALRNSLRMLFLLLSIGTALLIFLILISLRMEHTGWLFGVVHTLTWTIMILDFVVTFWLTQRWDEKYRLAVAQAPGERGEGEPRPEPGAAGAGTWFIRFWPRLFQITAWVLVTVLAAVVILASVAEGPGGARGGPYAAAVELGGDAAEAPAAPGEEAGEPIVPFFIVLLLSLCAFIFALLLILGSVFIKIQLDKRVAAEGLSEERRVPWEFAHMVALELGMAFLIASFITVTYELLLRGFSERQSESRYEKRLASIESRHRNFVVDLDSRHQAHLKQSEKSVFGALFGHNIEPKLLGEIYSVVESMKFVRKSFVMSLEFSPLSPAEREALHRPGHGEMVKVMANVMYEIHSNSNRPEPYPGGVDHWEPYFENPLQLDGGLDRFTGVSLGGCIEQDGYMKNGRFGPPGIQTLTGEDGVTRRLKFGKICLDRAGGRPATISYSYTTIKRMEDCHSWISTLPIENMQIVVNDHTEPGLRFHVETVSRGTAERTDPSATTHVWKVKESMLPNQGIILYWFPPTGVEPAPTRDGSPAEAAPGTSGQAAAGSVRTGPDPVLAGIGIRR